MVEKVVNYHDNWKKLKGNNKTITRSLFLEVERNREIFKVLEITHTDVKDMSLASVQNLFETLDTSIMETILFGIETEGDKDIWNYLSKKRLVTYKEDETETKLRKSLFGLMYFIVKRVQVLKTISKIEASFMVDVRVKQRLDNIAEHLFILEKALKQLPEIKEMYR